MAKQVSPEFVALFEQHHAQIAEGHVMNETFVHFADKLLAMLKDDYKKLYELEKKEHEELLAETRPKPKWPASSPAPVVFSTVEAPVLTTLARILEEAAEPRVDECELHGPQQQGAGLCHTANSMGYSTFSPPCNGCAMGQKDAQKGLWMSGFGVQSKRPDFQEPLHTPPHSPIERVCPGAPPRPAPAGGAALCATACGGGGGLCATSSIWGASAPLSPIELIPNDHF